MTNEELKQLIAQGEGLTVEFKEKATPPDIIARVIASFANTEGGLIIFGVREPNQVVSIEEDKLRRDIERAKCYLSGDFDTELDFSNFEGRKLGVLKVIQSKGIVAAGGGYYLRNGATSRPMSSEEIQKKLILSRPANVALTDISKAVEQQTKIIEELKEDFRKANAAWNKVALAIAGAIVGQLVKFLIESILSS